MGTSIGSAPWKLECVRRSEPVDVVVTRRRVPRRDGGELLRGVAFKPGNLLLVRWPPLFCRAGDSRCQEEFFVFVMVLLVVEWCYVLSSSVFGVLVSEMR